MDDLLDESAPEVPNAESSTDALQRQSPICVICQTNAAIYTCPRCNLRTCSLSCSTKHKTLGDGCSGIRNKAAYVPMNQYGYMALMNDYTFLEEVGRKVGEVGREIVQGGYSASANGPAGRGGRDARGRGRGRGRGGAQAKPASKRDVLKMQLDFRDIEIEFLPSGMERRTLNQSTWDFKNKTALLTVEFRFHPPRNALAPLGQPPDPPFTLLAHRIALETPLLSALQTHVAERHKSKKEKGVPPWVLALALPDEDVPDSFAPPLCVMSTSLDPLAALNANPHIPQPGRLLREGFYKLDSSKPLGAVLKHKHFVEFPTISVWEEDSFQGIIVDDKGAVVHDAADEPRPKRRRLNPKQAQKAISGLLGGYGSDDGSDGSSKEERNGMNLLGGYAGSDEEESGAAAPSSTFDVDADEWGDDDAEGETDDEYEGSPEELAAMLQKLREAGALRDPVKDGVLGGTEGVDEEQVDWGESGDEEDGGS
ncbi:hypothetical protein DICSQDRAFT_106143 [Dichomitus squalens LYAD-421 SS1]|uniref:HIT-type domain-containing protein n=1 Tax=Dichomitus squalens (strain LYAD-421) TaxID=732165 RepID=R7SYY0_DICSQ|nr:uncharacterized protein DICSQDRAFT_106143 [Dichomitus squalens LYAD-421 SS1]EJF61148.1 hypothetical protein DICSQDRAFT_106143 [Dichomitus squalens LYAD-421 SS1]